MDAAAPDALPPTLADFEARAAERLDPGPLGYYAGGAADEVTLRDNVAAWQRLALRPRVLAGATDVDTTVRVLGRERAHPLIVAPMAFHGLGHPEAEGASARGAAAARAPFCLSTFATTSAADLAAAAPDATRWFQLYVLRDRGVTRALVDAAIEHGFEALVLTVDAPVFGRRERDLRAGFAGAPSTAVPASRATGFTGGLTQAQLSTLVDPDLGWRDVEWLADNTDLPVLVKGILDPDDAALARDHGAAGVVVSNHGGRQLDTVPSGADALPPVVDAVGDDLDVLVDGGIRRGTDVLKALALGARAVMVGRPVLWGLAVAGEP